MEGVRGLINNGTFQTLDRSSIDENTLIFGTCLFFQTKAGMLVTAVITQVDDSIIPGSPKFLKTKN